MPPLLVQALRVLVARYSIRLGRARVVDVERGFFYLIQNGQLEVARAIYEAA